LNSSPDKESRFWNVISRLSRLSSADTGGFEVGVVEDGGVDESGAKPGGVEEGGVEEGVEDGGVDEGGVDEGGVEEGVGASVESEVESEVGGVEEWDGGRSCA
jgi:hypothetical protein